MTDHVIYALERREVYLTGQLAKDRAAPPMVERERNALRDALSILRRLPRVREVLAEASSLLARIDDEYVLDEPHATQCESMIEALDECAASISPKETEVSG